MRDDLPTGTVTFLFTDVERSTKLLHSLGAEPYAEALAEHRRVIRQACSSHGGVEVDTQATSSSSRARALAERSRPHRPSPRTLPPGQSRFASKCDEIIYYGMDGVSWRGAVYRAEIVEPAPKGA